MELHAADMGSTTHREVCQRILAHLFGQQTTDLGGDHVIAHQNGAEHIGTSAVDKNKVLRAFL